MKLLSHSAYILKVTENKYMTSVIIWKQKASNSFEREPFAVIVNRHTPRLKVEHIRSKVWPIHRLRAKKVKVAFVVLSKSFRKIDLKYFSLS